MPAVTALEPPLKKPCLPGLHPVNDQAQQQYPFPQDRGFLYAQLWFELSENSAAAYTPPTPSSCPLSFPSLFLFPLLYLYRHFPPINSNSLNPILASASQRTQDLDYTNSLASRPFTVWIYSLIVPWNSPLLLDKAFKDSLYISFLLLL